MEEVLVIGAGPAGLLAAAVARERGARVRVISGGIGSTHIMPGWLGVLKTDGPLEPALVQWFADHPAHPYTRAGVESLERGIEVFEDICASWGLRFTGNMIRNYRLPTALGALADAALVPESFRAGDAASGGPMLIASPSGWRDFYPALCAGNLSRQGIAAAGVTFELPEMYASKFDSTATNMARILHSAEVRARIANELRPRLSGAQRVGFPAILGLEDHVTVFRDLQDRLGVPVFEIPTLPPSVPGMRIWLAFKAAFMRLGIQLLLDMEVNEGLLEGTRARGASVPGAARSTRFLADKVILATGGLYGGGILSDRSGALRESVFGLPLSSPTGGLSEWFSQKLLPADHPIHYAGVRTNDSLQPSR
jgi:glycerol-3-phosphate dehydrogenase subunit B